MALVAAAALAALMLTGDPSPCVDRTVAGPPEAAAALMARWETFKTSATKGAANVTFTESEVTARGIAYKDEKGAPVEDLQVYFCPDGRAQARGKVTALGLSTHVLVTGTLDLTGEQPRILVTDAQAGNLPGALGRRVVDSVLDQGDLRTLRLGARLTSIGYADGTVRLESPP
ncbi:MAG: hypothetical protein ABI782_08285 [Anaerolineaceae bacterium]